MRLRLQNVVPDFIDKEKTAYSQVWLNEIEINKGEHLHIVASSGKGKTSLMHFIYGLRKDYSGQIFYDQTEIKKLSTESFSLFRQNKVSIIFQDLRLFENETARKNIEIKRLLQPYHPASKIIEMFSRLGIENKSDQITRTCSYGEQQRIAIIRSLMQPFDLLLLDEPFSHLDKSNREKAMELIYEECKQRNATMIFADLKPLEMLKNEKILYL